LVGELETLANFYAGSFDPPPDFATLWRLAHPPQLACMRRHSFDLLTPRRKSAWERVAGKERGALLNEEATACFERVNRCYRTVLGRFATALVAQLAAELDEVLDDYAAFKRAAAVLDFDDLLEKARALVRQHDDVRRALGERYRHIFVDEFQDTDPVQTEILFGIAGKDRAGRWQDSVLRAGALFMVGDPKQAIYRFRGADIGSYCRRAPLLSGNCRKISFRSPPIFVRVPTSLAHQPLLRAPLSGEGQPGYVPLTSTLGDPDHDLPCAARITVDVPPDSGPLNPRRGGRSRCRSLHPPYRQSPYPRRGRRNRTAHCRRHRLLAPTGAELWRYERALEQRGLPIASQAGKSLFRRQEVQDLLALARVLADAGDTLAFGALLRGPLVGLTEEELLDITVGLPPHLDRAEAPQRFSVLTDVDHVAHPLARRTLAILQDLRKRVRATTPALLLAEAIERLAVRATSPRARVIVVRARGRQSRSVPNVRGLTVCEASGSSFGISPGNGATACPTMRDELMRKAMRSKSSRSTALRVSNGRW
jgi:CRISPR-associated exonuclease Cas4